jgi:hypothetical protein
MERNKEDKEETTEKREENSTPATNDKKNEDKEADSKEDESSAEEKPPKRYPKFPRMSISIPLSKDKLKNEINLPVLTIKQLIDPSTSKKYLITGGRDSIVRKWCFDEVITQLFP